MSLIVQKFGGTSVADCEKIVAAARKAIRAQKEGHQVVMVVSAMGKNTDVLVDLAKQINDRPPAREMDMLLSTGEQVSVALMAMAIHSLGAKAVSLTGAQIGIKTDSTHTKARIISIETERVKQLLDAGNIVIAAGFQGIDENMNITTLGRGGSDTTAVALAAVLDADACEIYTDVDGVYTTDPRLLAEARRVLQISYDEMLELASLGAGVMHSRSIEFAKKFGVPIHVRSSFTDITGTMIVDQPESKTRPVGGAAMTKNEARVTIEGVPDVPGISHELFHSIASKAISVDMIVQNIGADGRANISFTVPRDELEQTLEAVRSAADILQYENVAHDENVSKISVVGLGMAEQSGVADKMFRVLADAGINIQMITTSEIKISVLVSRADAQRALAAVHSGFLLDVKPDDAPESVAAVSRARAHDAAEVVARLRTMEDLTIDSIVLDDSQSVIALRRIPDRPGIAAQVFEAIAAKGILVDMIVQNVGRGDAANLSLTVPKEDSENALLVAKKIGEQLGAEEILCKADAAKLSVSGIGLRSHTGVGIRMFRALSDAGINVELINTSEVMVNVIVEGKQGKAGLTALNKAFADVLLD
ncbi:aspartate kinase [Blastopirellula sp. JC732]|uniref:aspartate kinase n=1 Tax=Blastopirellula sediminis TaxID=2894196 RepID=A0A9X1MJZ5_9BACT|nr:aspartate kinase [Blastopirellula sediminis]MCC9609559.1 aspartate kinase [Blastopirellula sediminis]MCC9627665.1 aspartate kinase [Blastopirellula sediminis]